MNSTENHRMQHSGCEASQKNPKAGQQHTSPNAGQKNLIGQQPGSNSSIRKLLLLINKGGVY